MVKAGSLTLQHIFIIKLSSDKNVQRNVLWTTDDQTLHMKKIEKFKKISITCFTRKAS